MRNILVFGATAIALTLGVVSANANGVDYSPYEVLVPQTAAPAPVPTETRAAFTTDQQGCTPSRMRIHGVWHRILICD